MGYFVMLVGLFLFLSGATGKFVPSRRPGLIEVPTAMNRIVCIWVGLLFFGCGFFLIAKVNSR
jgi:hypothetical protein